MVLNKKDMKVKYYVAIIQDTNKFDLFSASYINSPEIFKKIFKERLGDDYEPLVERKEISEKEMNYLARCNKNLCILDEGPLWHLLNLLNQERISESKLIKEFNEFCDIA
jgi:hypothetical protein